MPEDRSAQFRTQTPFLPQPLAASVLDELVAPFETVAAGEAQHTRIGTFLTQLMAAIDTVDLAINQNHANYLAGRGSWSYDTRIEIETRLRILKRQRQQVQEAYGRCNRRLKQLAHNQHHASTAKDTPETIRALAFVEAATQMLAPETVRLIWEIVEHRQSQEL